MRAQIAKRRVTVIKVCRLHLTRQHMAAPDKIVTEQQVHQCPWPAIRKCLTLSLDICPRPFKEVDLHSILPWDWATVGEEAVRLLHIIPAAAC